MQQIIPIQSNGDIKPLNQKKKKKKNPIKTNNQLSFKQLIKVI